MAELEGKTLGHHHLKQLLGRGGMAEVYLARDQHLFRDVAIKVVHSSRLDHVARFQREAEIIGPLPMTIFCQFLNMASKMAGITS
jgi:serine/threonine-protein kinase